ncbi:MAG: hypothetical protein WDN28_19745 [Chthoniobacter sp.]
MKTPTTYIPSQTLAGDREFIRQHSFTRWMSQDLLQAATDFCKNLGLIAIYSECSPDQLTRYLFWRAPQGARFEIRSGRPEEQFREFDRANVSKGWPLLSLHVNETDLYSAVWISPERYEAATAMLGFYGITPAERKWVADWRLRDGWA